MIEPDIPELEVPVLKIKLPLTPLAPAFDVCINKLPLEDFRLKPDFK